MLKALSKLIHERFQVASQHLLIMFTQENLNSVFIQVDTFSRNSICIICSLDRGYKTCAGRPGSLGYETKDANTYASWGVDYLKLDSCNLNGTAPEISYSIMRDALNATGRPIFYSLCGMKSSFMNIWR